MTPFELGLAVLSSAVYREGREKENFTPSAPGAVELLRTTDKTTGFEAAAYQYQGKIIIAYAGTNPSDLHDWATNAMLGFGTVEGQAKLAADFYQKVKATYGADITFTGHSLGGGLAALMGVFFNKSAVTFDPAPFLMAAAKGNAQKLQQYLTTPNANRPAYAADPDLASYTTVESPMLVANPNLAGIITGMGVVGGIANPISPALAALLVTLPYPTVIRGESNIKAIAVSGEILTFGYKGFGNTSLNDLRIQSGIEPEYIQIKWGDVPLGLADLHSIQLLVVAATDKRIETLFQQMPMLKYHIFDSQLYQSSSGTSTVDFLNKLVQSEYTGSAPTGFIKKFVDDLSKLMGNVYVSQTAKLRDALSIVAMEYYYFKDAVSATSAFTIANGGLHFKYSDIDPLGKTSYKSLPRLVAAVEDTLSTLEKPFSGRLLNQNAWHIQQDNTWFTWTAAVGNQENDAAIGGIFADILDAGAGNDILIGGDGDDVLTGGKGFDCLLGGYGVDKYVFKLGDGSDIIADVDGQGLIMVGEQKMIGGKKAADNFWISDDKTIMYSLVTNGSSGSDLYISTTSGLDSITIRNWQAGQLGITLSNVPVAVVPVVNTYNGDFKKKISGTSYVFNGLNYASDGVQIDAPDMLTGSVSADLMNGGGGNDALSGFGGDDSIDGGAGDDVLAGGLGQDTLNGGAGNDYIFGSGVGTQSKPSSTIFNPPVAVGTELSRGFNWVAYVPSVGVITFNGFILDTLSGDASNIIDGGAGNDFILAGSGSDIVHGGADSDEIHGLGKNDTLFGDGGNDKIYGDGSQAVDRIIYVPLDQHGMDVIDGGTGDDWLYGQGLGDYLYGGAGMDRLFGDDDNLVKTPVSVHGNDYLDGGADDDQLTGGGKDDTLFGGIGNDKLWGDGDAVATSADQGDDYLDGEDGNDYLEGGGKNDELFGGVGNDVLYGDDVPSALQSQYHGDDYLDGEEGDDNLEGGGKNDTLFGGSNNDALWGDSSTAGLDATANGKDYLDGEDGDDWLAGGGNADEIYGGFGNDEMRGDDRTSIVAGAAHGADTMYGEDGSDSMFGDGGNDVLYGGDDYSADVLHGDNIDLAGEFHGNDVLEGGVGNDTLFGGGRADTLYGGDGDDAIVGDYENLALSFHGNDLLDGGNGKDTLFGNGGADTIIGGAGDDVLKGDSGDDVLNGDDGFDYLAGGSGNDMLSGGTGMDYLEGGVGNDVYLFSAGDGQDMVDNSAALAGEVDELRFDATLSRQNAKFIRYANDLIVSFANTPDSVQVSGFFTNAGEEKLTFADGTTYTRATVPLSSPNQQLSAAGGVVAMGSGGDTVNGLGGNDLIYGGGGNDSIAGGNGDDVLVGGVGNDVLAGGDGGNIVSSFDGRDAYLINLNEGIDVIKGSVLGDVLRLGGGIKLSNISVRNKAEECDYLTIIVKDEITGKTLNEVTFISGLKVEFSGVELPFDEMRRLALVGTDADNYMDAVRGGYDDLMIAKAGNDVINGYDGSDTLEGGGGKDTLDGGEGNDILDGGAGNDLLYTSNGNDTYRLGRGDGSDVIRYRNFVRYLNDGTAVASPDFSLTGDFDTVELKSGVAPSDIKLYRVTQNALINPYYGESFVGESLVIQIANSSDQLWINNNFAGNGDVLINAIQFSDGTRWDAGAIAAKLINQSGVANTMTGTLGNDTFTVDHPDDVIIENANAGVDTVISNISNSKPSKPYTYLWDNVENLTLAGSLNLDGYGNALANVITGNGGDNVLKGFGGNDTIIGGAGSDLLVGMDGADSLNGGMGSDTYFFSSYDGLDQVNNAASDYATAIDTVQLWSSISSANVVLSRVGDDLLIKTGAMDSITVKGHFSIAGDQQIDQIKFDNGNVTWDKAAIAQRAGVLLGPTAGADNLIGTIGNDVIRALAGNDTVSGGAGDDQLFGDADNDTLNGEAGNDLLDGGTGNDIMSGGTSNDTYVVDAVADVVTENPNEGADLVQSSITYTLGANVENLTLTGALAINATGNTLNNVLIGNAAANTLNGGAGADTMIGGAGNDTYVVDNAADVITENAAEGTDLVQSSATYTLGANIENLTLTGVLAINATGNTLNNVLTGNAASNVLAGDIGNDTYYVSTGDSVVENSAAGTDTVVSDVTWTLGANLENLTLSGASAINATGNTLNNVLTGNAAANTLNGGVGADTMIGGAGNDTYVVDNIADVVTENLNEGTDLVQSSVAYTLGANIENVTLTGALAINATGNTLNNVLTGNAAVNVLAGGIGNDTYYVSTGDSVVENSAAGTDTVVSDVTWTLGANLENLTLSGASAINATGNTLNNVLTGNSAANTLDGATGADAMIGGAGNDTYVVDNAADTVTENLNEGTDLVKSSVTYTLSANVENLTLTGALAINATGNALNNVLTGNAAANNLSGGAGDDTYVVDNIADVVSENLNEGTDLVQSSVTYALGANVEKLTLTGAAAINGTGNSLDNVFGGNAGANILAGGAGNDIYYVSTGDSVVENANEGTVDIVVSDVTWMLGNNLEELQLVGTNAINATGNALNNRLVGNAAANTLDGGIGADTMLGGAGNDIYVVDNAGDVVTENAAEGIDQVKSSLTYTLGANVEALTLTGSVAINGTGNASDNLLVGNGVNNTLNGATGTDILQGAAGADILTDTSGNNLFDGGSGNDTLTGGIGAEFFAGGTGNDTITTNTGADVIAFNRGDGMDVVNASTGKDNTLSLGKGIKYADLLFKKSVNDLVLVTGVSEQVTLKDWYLSVNNHSIANLQVVIEGTTDYNAASLNKLNNKKVEQFNFDGLATAFDNARAANPALTSWALSSSLLNFYLNSSDTAAIGGDLAYQYAKSGNLSSFSMTPAQGLLSNAQFGTANQNLQAVNALQDLSPRLL